MTAAQPAGTKLESAPIVVPGLSGYRGKFVVIKIGGSDEAASASIFEDIDRLRAEGVKVVVVHGGGKALSHWLKLAGHQTRFVDGLRVTDAETLEVAIMVFAGKVNKEIVSRFATLGLRAVGISGVDGGLVLVEPETHPPGLGLVGRIVAVDTLLLDRLVESEMVPVVAPIAADRNGQMYNVNRRHHRLRNSSGAWFGQSCIRNRRPRSSRRVWRTYRKGDAADRPTASGGRHHFRRDDPQSRRGARAAGKCWRDTRRRRIDAARSH